MNKLVTLHFMPQDQLDLASSHEKNELQRYRCLELSFLTIHPPVSRLMKAIGMESLNRLHNLQDVAKRMDLAACVDELPRFYYNNKGHFFVIDEPMGIKLLEQAEAAAIETCTFFGWLLETNDSPELHKPLFNFVMQKYNEHKIIQECREHWEVSFLSQSHAIRN